MSAFFGLRWRGSDLAGKVIRLPSKLKVKGLTGGTLTWERAQCAFAIGESLPEFERRPDDEQNWLLATFRMRNRIETIKLVQSG